MYLEEKADAAFSSRKTALLCDSTSTRAVARSRMLKEKPTG
jgi:hypothetical protein